MINLKINISKRNYIDTLKGSVYIINNDYCDTEIFINHKYCPAFFFPYNYYTIVDFSNEYIKFYVHDKNDILILSRYRNNEIFTGSNADGQVIKYKDLNKYFIKTNL